MAAAIGAASFSTCSTCVLFRDIDGLLRELIAAGVTCNGRLDTFLLVVRCYYTSSSLGRHHEEDGREGGGNLSPSSHHHLPLLRGLRGFLWAACVLITGGKLPAAAGPQVGGGSPLPLPPPLVPRCHARPLWRILLGDDKCSVEEVLDAALYSLRLVDDITVAPRINEEEEGEEWMDADQFINSSLPAVPFVHEAVGMLIGFPPPGAKLSFRLRAKISAVLGHDEASVAASVAALAGRPGFLWLTSRESATALLHRAPPCSYAIRLSKTHAISAAAAAIVVSSQLTLVISFVTPVGVVSHRLLDRCCASSSSSPLSLGAVLASEEGGEVWGGVPAAQYRPLPVRADPEIVRAICVEARFSRYADSEGSDGSGRERRGYLVAQEEEEGGGVIF